MNTWYPKISFAIFRNQLHICLDYNGQYGNKLTITHHSWIIHDDFDNIYEIDLQDIKDALYNFLYLDLKGRPAVQEFIKSGPPGGGVDGNVNELVEGIVNSVDKIYREFIANY